MESNKKTMTFELTAITGDVTVTNLITIDFIDTENGISINGFIAKDVISFKKLTAIDTTIIIATPSVKILIASVTNCDEEQYIMLKDGKEFIKIEMKDIKNIEAEDGFTFVYCTNGKRLISTKTIKWFIDLLPAHYFHKIDSGSIVGRLHIESFVIISGRSGAIVLIGGGNIKISRSEEKGFVKWEAA